MTFSSEEVRHAYHLLPTEIQALWTEFEWELSLCGFNIHIVSVIGSQVVVRIDK